LAESLTGADLQALPIFRCRRAFLKIGMAPVRHKDLEAVQKMALWRSRPAAVGTPGPLAGLDRCKPSEGRRMFFFFSNRLSCIGSLLILALVTAAVLFAFGMLRFGMGRRCI
jgi:hypothetical protein